MRIIFMGNPQIASTILESIHHSEHELAGVVSNVPKYMGRRRSLRHTAVGDYALKHKLNLLLADSLDSPQLHEELIELAPDIFVIVAFRILPHRILTIPKNGAMNLHTSLLPKYRGAAPIQHALMNGDQETGLTTFIIEAKVDTGAIICQEKLNIDPQDNYGSLSKKMAELGGPFILKSIKVLAEGPRPVPQNNVEATFAPKISKEMCKIDWSSSTQRIHNQVRALSPYPGSYTTFRGKRLKIFKSLILNSKSKKSPGKIILLGNDRIAVACGDGILELLEIQMEGKRRMIVFDWLKGIQILDGRLGL